MIYISYFLIFAYIILSLPTSLINKRLRGDLKCITHTGSLISFKRDFIECNLFRLGPGVA